VGTEHLLLALLREDEGVAAQVLTNLNLKLEDVRAEVLNLLGGPLDVAPAPDAAKPPRKVPLPDQEFNDDEALAALFMLIRRELRERKDDAVTDANYELAAELRDVEEQTKALIERLHAVFEREKPAPPAPETPPPPDATPPPEPPKAPPPSGN